MMNTQTFWLPIRCILLLSFGIITADASSQSNGLRTRLQQIASHTGQDADPSFLQVQSPSAQALIAGLLYQKQALLYHPSEQSQLALATIDTSLSFLNASLLKLEKKAAAEISKNEFLARNGISARSLPNISQQIEQEIGRSRRLHESLVRIASLHTKLKDHATRLQQQTSLFQRQWSDRTGLLLLSAEHFEPALSPLHVLTDSVEAYCRALNYAFQSDSMLGIRQVRFEMLPVKEMMQWQTVESRSDVLVHLLDIRPYLEQLRSVRQGSVRKMEAELEWNYRKMRELFRETDSLLHLVKELEHFPSATLQEMLASFDNRSFLPELFAFQKALLTVRLAQQQEARSAALPSELEKRLTYAQQQEQLAKEALSLLRTLKDKIQSGCRFCYQEFLTRHYGPAGGFEEHLLSAEKMLSTRQYTLAKMMKKWVIEKTQQHKSAPVYANWLNKPLPLYEQSGQLVTEQGDYVTLSTATDVLGNLFVTGYQSDSQHKPFIAMVSNGKVVWLHYFQDRQLPLNHALGRKVAANGERCAILIEYTPVLMQKAAFLLAEYSYEGKMMKTQPVAQREAVPVSLQYAQDLLLVSWQHGEENLSIAAYGATTWEQTLGQHLRLASVQNLPDGSLLIALQVLEHEQPLAHEQEVEAKPAGPFQSTLRFIRLSREGTISLRRDLKTKETLRIAFVLTTPAGHLLLAGFREASQDTHAPDPDVFHTLMTADLQPLTSDVEWL